MSMVVDNWATVNRFVELLHLIKVIDLGRITMLGRADGDENWLSNIVSS